MISSHDRAARRIAKRYHGRYRRRASPDVKWRDGSTEVKSTADEIPTALRQLSGVRGDGYVALPSSEIKRGLKRLRGLKTGLMNYTGNIVKLSTRKKRS